MPRANRLVFFCCYISTAGRKGLHSGKASAGSDPPYSRYDILKTAPLCYTFLKDKRHTFPGQNTSRRNPAVRRKGTAMDNLFHPEDLKIDRQLQKETNPVSGTAEMTLFQLAAGGDREAAAIAEALGLTFQGTQTAGSKQMPPEEAIAFRIVLEVRYRVMELLAAASGCDTVADLPCGYTPLPIALSRKGKKYIGLDLPAVISAVSEIILPMIGEDQRDNVRFTAVDATNAESMAAAFRDSDGRVCFITLGLLMYLSDPELEAMARGIRNVLERHGGCWIIADPEVEVQHFSILKALTGDRFDQVMRERAHIVEEKSDTKLGQNALTIHLRSREKDMERAEAFLVSHGLRAERLIAAGHLQEDPASFSLISGEQRSAVKKVLEETAFWKITSDGSVQSGQEKAGTPDEGGQAFVIRAERKDGLLELSLSGRLDTLSSPEFLAFFEKEAAEREIRKVALDCSGLRFISSAGLRVLLMIKKRCRDGITMTGANEYIKEILAQTGFDLLLTT